jgi:hypothetical protein
MGSTRVLELDEMVAAELDSAAVERLFEDLAFETTVLGVALRFGDGDPSAKERPSEPNLRQARTAILSGEATGAQLRYVHQGVEWWDTVMRTGSSFRVVRVKKQRSES